MKKILTFMFVVMLLSGCSKTLNEEDAKKAIQKDLKSRYGEKYNIDKIVKAGGREQSCLVSSCGYLAWVTNDDKTNSLVYYIEDDGKSSKVSHDIKEEIQEYLRTKYNEAFVLYDFSYNQCSNRLNDEWIINNCDYGVIAYPTSNKNDIFFIGYKADVKIVDNYK